MKKSVIFFLMLFTGILLTGYSPKPRSDLAEYKRLPLNRRIDRLAKAGKDFYLRRKYEQALSIFSTILALDEDNLEAKMWINKVKNRLNREQNEQKKQNLYKKYGRLYPEELIYNNWHWGPSVGHFEVRYSKPRPYNPPEREFHPTASDQEIKEQLQKAEKSGKAEDYFELSMRYWSRKMQDKALKAYFKAKEIDPQILAKDDELLLANAIEDSREKISDGQAGAQEYFTSGQLGMIQGDRKTAIEHLVNASVLNPELKNKVAGLIASCIVSPAAREISVPPELFSYRQAYVYNNDNDMLYLQLTGMPRENNLIFPVDVAFDLEMVDKIELESDDVVFAHALPGIDGATRLWFTVPPRNKFAEYKIRAIIYLNREKKKWLDLSNYSMLEGQPENWAFVIGSEFNFGEHIPPGDYEKNIDGIQVTGYHLALSDGKGPQVAFSYFTEPLPQKADIWKLMTENADLFDL
jgi:tetratricopeptide (TPR) repeat protein